MKFGIVPIVGYIVTALVILVLGLVLLPDEYRSDYFWPRLFWIEFLALLVWGFIGGFISTVATRRKDRRGLGGILPSFGVIVCIYAAISFLLMLVQAFVPNWAILNRYHFVAQILIAAAAFLLCIFVCFSLKVQKSGRELIPDGVKSPIELCTLLRSEEDRLSAMSLRTDVSKEIHRLHDELKALRERISYSLPRVGYIGQTTTYIAFANAIQQLRDLISAIEPKNVKSLANLTKILEEVSSLRRRVDVIVSTVKRT